MQVLLGLVVWVGCLGLGISGAVRMQGVGAATVWGSGPAWWLEALVLLVDFCWQQGIVLVPVWTWRLPFWPASRVKWALWANAVGRPLLWQASLTPALALGVIPLFLVGGPGLMRRSCRLCSSVLRRSLIVSIPI